MRIGGSALIGHLWVPLSGWPSPEALSNVFGPQLPNRTLADYTGAKVSQGRFWIAFVRIADNPLEARILRIGAVLDNQSQSCLHCQWLIDCLQKGPDSTRPQSHPVALRRNMVQRMEWIAPDIFLIHAGPDTAVAEHLYGLLSSSHKVFLDSKCLQPGDMWPDVLQLVTKSARMCVILISQNTGPAFYAQSEIASAIQLFRDTKRRCVPIYIGGKPGKEVEFPYGLNIIQGMEADPANLEPIAAKLRELLSVEADQQPRPAASNKSGPLHPGLNAVESAKEKRSGVRTIRWKVAVLVCGLAILVIGLTIFVGLRKGTEGRTSIVGVTRDAEGRALGGIRISAPGAQTVTTNVDGKFTIEFSTTQGESIMVHAEGAGYQPANRLTEAGANDAIIVLNKVNSK